METLLERTLYLTLAGLFAAVLVTATEAYPQAFSVEYAQIGSLFGQNGQQSGQCGPPPLPPCRGPEPGGGSFGGGFGQSSGGGFSGGIGGGRMQLPSSFGQQQKSQLMAPCPPGLQKKTQPQGTKLPTLFPQSGSKSGQSPQGFGGSTFGGSSFGGSSSGGASFQPQQSPPPPSSQQSAPSGGSRPPQSPPPPPGQ